jgi:hypothetical protein
VKPRTSSLLGPSALALAGAATFPSPAAAGKPGSVQVADLGIVALDDAIELAAVKVGPADAVKVTGAGTAVKFVPPSAEVRHLEFGVRHVDDGDHSFDIVFGPPGATSKVGFQCDLFGAGKVSLICDGMMPGKVSFICDGAMPGKVSLQCDGVASPHSGSATIVPQFAGAKTYSIRVTKAGKVLHDLTGRTGAFTIPDFEGLDEGGKPETLGVKVAYGTVRPDAWSITMVHESFTISITPDATQAFTGLGEVSLKTTGLPEVTLTGLLAK